MTTRPATSPASRLVTSLPVPENTPGEPDLRQAVRDFLAVTPFRPCIDPMIEGFDPDFSAALGARGFLGLTIPAEYGGHGRSPLERYIVIEELLAAGAPVSAHWLADRQIAPSLLTFGSEALRRRYLPAIARGTCFFAVGLSEPDSGSDLASIRTRATRTDGGWLLSGTKIWTTWAHRAHAIMVLARTSARDGDRHGGLSQLIVPLPAERVTVRPISGLSGLAHFNEVSFSEAFVPADMLVGTEGRGWQQATAELAYERSGPDRLLSTFGLVAHTSGPERGALLGRLWALRQASMAVNGAIASGVPPVLQAVMVKDLGTQFENEVLDTALAQSGAEPDLDGDDPAAAIARAQVQAPTLTLRGGTTEILRGIVARGLGIR
jgi:Acyl-CoA dehydrogenase, N-terminal domain/Acyl-CoA dehydrogenase, middle domain